jgi:hypothetical protein
MESKKVFYLYCWLTHVLVNYVVIIESFAMEKEAMLSVYCYTTYVAAHNTEQN